MSSLPEYFGIFRPGYGIHTHLVLVKNIQITRYGILSNYIDFISIEGGTFVESPVEKTHYKTTNLSGQDNVSYKFLPFNVVTSDNRRYPIIFFKTTGFIHSPTSPRMKYMLSDAQIKIVKSKMIMYNVVETVNEDIDVSDIDYRSYDSIDDDESYIRPSIVRPSTVTPTTTPIFVIQNHLENERNKNVNCSITLKPLKECKELSVLSCFHIFDKDSILHYRETNTKCPVCRNESTIIHNATFS